MTGSVGEPDRPRWTVVLLWLLPLAYFAWVLFGDMSTRAVDPSDPMDQMGRAAFAASEFHRAGPIAWAGFLISDTYAMPVLHGLLSLGVLAGLPANHLGYEWMLGSILLALLGGIQTVLWRRFGLSAMALFSAFFCGSNIVLGQSLYGGHQWLGQCFLWAVLGAALLAGWGPLLGAAGAFALGVTASCGVLASFYLIPYLGLLLGCWGWRWSRACLRARALDWRPAAAMAAGLVIVPLAGEVATLAVARQHFWTVFIERFGYAQNTDMAYKSVHGYLFSYLRLNESAAFSVVLIAAALAGLAALARGANREDGAGPALAALPVLALVFFELPGVIRVGRAYVPLLVLLFAVAAVGLSRLIERLSPPSARGAAAAAVAALLLACGLGEKRKTLAAFHAGREIGRRADRLIVVGFSVPYSYLPGRDVRATFIGDLQSQIRTGDEWVFVSPFSHWFTRDFLDESDPQRIPTRKVFQSDASHEEFDGVETIPFELFTNDALFYRFMRGEIPFPVKNRLYRARDFLRACGRT